MGKPSVLPLGSKLLCGVCHRHLATTNKDIVPKGVIQSADFDFTPGNERKKGDSLECAFCKVLYWRFEFPDGSVRHWGLPKLVPLKDPGAGNGPAKG